MNPDRSCLILTEDSPESYSPAGERIRQMALAGSSFFERTVVVALGKTDKRSTRDTRSNVLLYSIGSVRATPYPISAFFDPIKFLAYFIHGINLSIQYKPSFVVASMPPIETGAAAWLLAGLLRKKLVIDLRDDWESSQEVQLSRYVPLKLLKITFAVAKRIYSFSRVVLTATRTIADTLRQRGVQVPMLLASNGANTSLFFPEDFNSRRSIRQKWNLPLERTVVIYCGSGGNPYYRLDMILSCAKMLPIDAKNRIFFVFYLYSAVDHYKRLRDELGISEELVQIRGPLPRGSLSGIIGACDVGLVPFDDKPYLLCARSMKMYEYLSSGLYVVGSGPKGGELDLFFSINPDLGMFVLPKPDNFAAVLAEIAAKHQIFGERQRKLRHMFLRENYDNREIMKKAMACVASLGD